MDKRDIPLTVLEEFVRLKYYCHDLQNQNYDTLAANFGDFSVYIHDKKSIGKFYYNITNPSLDSNTHKGKVHITYKPRHQSDPGEYSTFTNIDRVGDSLAGWLDLVTAYNKISLDVNDRFIDKYQEEFFSDFRIIEDDADAAPFDDQQQKLLGYTLEAFEEAIEVIDFPEERKSDILRDTIDLKNKIAILTKNQVVRLWSRLIAKIKIQGHDFNKVFYEEARKSLAKAMLERGYSFLSEQVPKLLHHFFH